MASKGGVWAKPAVLDGGDNSPVFFGQRLLSDGRMFANGNAWAAKLAYERRTGERMPHPANMAPAEYAKWARRAVTEGWLGRPGLMVLHGQAEEGVSRAAR